MSRVEINADGRQVVVDHVGDLPYLIEQAMGAWQATDKPKATSGFAPEGTLTFHDPSCGPQLCVCRAEVSAQRPRHPATLKREEL